MLTHPLLPKLRTLKLSGMALTLDTRSTQAVQGNLSPIEFLAMLLDDELERRQNQRLKRGLAESGINAAKTLAQFDFAAVPQLNRSLVQDLATCGFIAKAENILICGPTGTGKSHLANAVAFEGLRHGHSVRIRPTHHLLAELHAARADGTYAKHFSKLCSVDLLVVDDFGLRPLGVQAAEDLYEIIRERYERKAMVITSNRAFQEWPEVFGDGLLSSAAMDRLTHHCHTLTIRGQSYRQRSRRKEGLLLGGTSEISPDEQSKASPTTES